MWVCSKHVKKALRVLDTPHIQKAPNGIKCSLCDDQAIANFYYTHKPSQLKKKRWLYDPRGIVQKQTS
ncbi:hypothetical protein J2S09_000635 [Bacillus fengqiuensis]|nr:hypothetical protein [Bacillus fengqiuensis]